MSIYKKFFEDMQKLSDNHFESYLELMETYHECNGEPGVKEELDKEWEINNKSFIDDACKLVFEVEKSLE